MGVVIDKRKFQDFKRKGDDYSKKLAMLEIPGVFLIPLNVNILCLLANTLATDKANLSKWVIYANSLYIAFLCDCETLEILFYKKMTKGI